jgi:protein-disulfide isomerase
MVLLGCGGAPAPAPRVGAAPPVSSSSKTPPPAWPPGLVPCAKDAPAGEGCARTAAPSAEPGKPPPANGGGQTSPRPPKVIDDTVWNVPVGPDDPVRGPRDALVTLVVFSDFECPFCKRGAETIDKLAAAYPNDLRVVWKDLPLPMHEHAEAAAELARTARAQNGDKGFWAAHDLLYAAQPDLGDASLRAIAGKLDMKWTDVRAAIRTARFGAVIRGDVALSDRTDVQATPTTFVNGRKVAGAQPYDTVRAVIDVELEKARHLLSGGVPRAQLYATIAQKGRQTTPPADTSPP